MYRMKLCYLTVIVTALLSAVQPSCQAPVNYNVSLVFDNQCATKNDVEEIARAQNVDLSRTLLRTYCEFNAYV